jgi:ribose 5-phosphate isomerase B
VPNKSATNSIVGSTSFRNDAANSHSFSVFEDGTTKGFLVMRVAVGSDHRGTEVRHHLLDLLRALGHEAVDVGPDSPDSVDYPDVAALVAQQVSRNEVDRGILICGTGIGMAISANKFLGVRAAPCHDDITAEMSRRHNDLNVLCLSADLLGEKLIARMVELWLTTPFEGGRHARRIEKIAEQERRVHGDRSL